MPLADLAGSLCCDTADEAKTLIPSLSSKMDDESLQPVLDELQKYRMNAPSWVLDLTMINLFVRGSFEHVSYWCRSFKSTAIHIRARRKRPHHNWRQKKRRKSMNSDDRHCNW